MPPPPLDRQVLSIRSLSGPADKTPGRWLGNGRAAPVANPQGSAGDAVEEPADGGEEAVLLFGEHHVRGVLEDDKLGVGQAPRHVFGGAGPTRPVVPAGQHQHRMRHRAQPVLDVDPPIFLCGNWRMTSGAYLASPAVRRRYSPSAAPRGSRKWNGIWSSISALTSSWVPRVIQPGPAVEDQQREPRRLPPLLDIERGICHLDQPAHRRTSALRKGTRASVS